MPPSCKLIVLANHQLRFKLLLDEEVLDNVCCINLCLQLRGHKGSGVMDVFNIHMPGTFLRILQSHYAEGIYSGCSPKVHRNDLALFHKMQLHFHH